VKSAVQERIPVGNDIVLVPVEVLVCQSCGERFYDRATLRRLEELEDDLAACKPALREVGKVLELASAR
jgi:YgiT-type zinc finger domain-containing protein